LDLFSSQNKEDDGTLGLSASRRVDRIAFRSLKRIVDRSKVRFTANPKLALQAQTVGFAAVSLHQEWLAKIH